MLTIGNPFEKATPTSDAAVANNGRSSRDISLIAVPILNYAPVFIFPKALIYFMTRIEEERKDDTKRSRKRKMGPKRTRENKSAREQPVRVVSLPGNNGTHAARLPPPAPVRRT